MDTFYQTALEARSLTQRLYSSLLSSKPSIPTGRIVLVRTNTPAVVVRLLPQRELYCMLLTNEKPQASFLPSHLISWPDCSRPLQRHFLNVAASELVALTDQTLPIPSDLLASLTTSLISHLLPRDLDRLQDLFVAFLQTPVPLRMAPFPNTLLKDPELYEGNLRLQSLQQLLEGSFYCLQCHELAKHFGQFHQRASLVSELAEARFRLSDGNLALLPEYHARLQLLRHLHHVSSSSSSSSAEDSFDIVQIKGRVACELNTVDELLTTELLFDGLFSAPRVDEAVAVALLSTMVFQERKNQTSSSEDTPSTMAAQLGDASYRSTLPEVLLAPLDSLLATAKRLTLLQKQFGLSYLPSLDSRLSLALVPVVYHWARGQSFLSLTQLTDVPEGAIVRCIVRLDESCRELASAGKIIGDPSLVRKMAAASSAIKRDICFASSLYI